MIAVIIMAQLRLCLKLDRKEMVKLSACFWMRAPMHIKFSHSPRNPLQIDSPLAKLTLKHWRTLIHTLDMELIRNRDDTGKLPVHIACQTIAPLEVLAMLGALGPAALQIADYSGALPLHDCTFRLLQCAISCGARWSRYIGGSQS